MKRTFGVILVAAGIASCAGSDDDPKAVIDTELDASVPEASVDVDAATSDAATTCESGWCPLAPPGIDLRRVLNAVWGTSANDVWAVGTSGTIAHFDGTHWKTLESRTDQTLRAVWGSGAGDVWVASTPDVILRSDGWQNGSATFTNVEALPRVFFAKTTLTLAIWGASPADVWVGGEAIPIDFDGLQYEQAWRRLDPDVGPPWEGMPVAKLSEPVSLRAFWGSGVDDVWAVGGDDFLIMHEDGSQSAGSNGKTYHRTLDDAGVAQWAELDSRTTAILHGVWGTAGGDVWAVGRRGTIRRIARGATRWEPVTSPTTENLRGLWGSSASDIWAVGDNGTVIHFDGTSWTSWSVPFEDGDKPNLHGIWGSGPNDVWAVGERGLVHFTGGAP